MLNLFPYILRRALKSLANEERQRIVSYIILKGSTTPKKLCEELEMKSNRLAYHLKELVMGNILERVIVRGRVKYRLSFFGAKLIYHMFEALMPPRAREKEEVIAVFRDYVYPVDIIREDVYRKVYGYTEAKPIEYSTQSR